MFQYDDEETRESIGSILRRQREMRKLKLEEISEELKIRPRHLKALENGQFHLIPGRLYQRSFLKTYAQFLNLDQSHVLRMFDQHEKSRGRVREELEGTAALEGSVKEMPRLPPQPPSVPNRTGYRLAVFAGLVLGILCFLYLSKPGMIETDEAAPGLTSAAAESLTTEADAVDTTTFDWRLDNLLASSPEMLLRIEAKGDSWVKVIADKNTLFSGIIAAGMAIEAKANDHFSIHLGRNEGVDFWLNGMKMKLLEKGIHLLDRDNYRSYFPQDPSDKVSEVVE
jgi:cytoskeleton protein RodZ